MITVVDARREILLNPKGTNVWVSLRDPLQGLNLKLGLPPVRSSSSEFEQCGGNMVLSKATIQPKRAIFRRPHGLVHRNGTDCHSILHC